jgi:hypothetical protein
LKDELEKSQNELIQEKIKNSSFSISSTSNLLKKENDFLKGELENERKKITDFEFERMRIKNDILNVIKDQEEIQKKTLLEMREKEENVENLKRNYKEAINKLEEKLDEVEKQKREDKDKMERKLKDQMAKMEQLFDLVKKSKNEKAKDRSKSKHHENRKREKSLDPNVRVVSSEPSAQISYSIHHPSTVSSLPSQYSSTSNNNITPSNTFFVSKHSGEYNTNQSPIEQKMNSSVYDVSLPLFNESSPHNLPVFQPHNLTPHYSTPNVHQIQTTNQPPNFTTSHFSTAIPPSSFHQVIATTPSDSSHNPHHHHHYHRTHSHKSHTKRSSSGSNNIPGPLKK